MHQERRTLGLIAALGTGLLTAQPGAAETRAGIETLRAATAEVDASRLAHIAGAPVYHWMDMLERKVEAGEPLTAHPHRVLAYVALAMYDATVAAWDLKYIHKRLRPPDLDAHVRTHVAVPNSPSYPSEHSSAAAAAAGVLAHFFPDNAAMYMPWPRKPGSRASGPACSSPATTPRAWTSASKSPGR